MQKAQQRIFNKSIKYKDIYIYTATILLTQFRTPYSRSFNISYLPMSAIIAIIRIGTLKKIRSFEFFRSNLYQFVVVLTHHYKIYIVIPRNKPLVPDCSKKGTAVHPAFKSMTLAYFNQLHGKIQLNRPHSLHSGRNGITSTIFFFQKIIRQSRFKFFTNRQFIQSVFGLNMFF